MGATEGAEGGDDIRRRPSPRRRRGAGRIATIAWLCSTVHVTARHVLCNPVAAPGRRPANARVSRGDGGEQLRPLGELPVRQVVVEHALPGRLPKAPRLGGIGQQPGQRRREGIEVLGLDQHAVLAGDLVEDAAGAAGVSRATICRVLSAAAAPGQPASTAAGGR